MSVVKKILATALFIVVAIYAPQLAPVIGGWLGASGLLATAIGMTIITVGMGLIQSLLVNKPQATPAEAAKVTVRLTEPPRWINAGISRQGGGAVFGEFDSAGDFWFIVVHSDSILTDTIQYYLDDIPVTLDGSGWVTTDEFCLNDKKESYSGSGTKVPYFQIWTTTYTEDDPVPARVSALDSAFPSKWTADHKLVGTTFSVVRCKALDLENRYKIYRWRGVFGLGEPGVSIAGQWSNMYDPADEGQTLGDRSTYLPSRNPALIWAWFRTHPYGRNKSESSINWTKVAEQAAICDQIVTGISGSHTRYRCDIAIPENKDRGVAEQEILLSADAQLVFDDDGKCWPRVGHWETPTLALTRNRDIVAMESVEAQNGESETQGVIVRYIDPESNYTMQPSAPWYNPNYYVSGQANTFLTVDIPAIQDHNQAMRIAKALGMRSQPLHKAVPTTGLRGLKARQERIVNLNYDNVFAGDYEIVTPVEVDRAGMFCGFGIVPVDSNRWTLTSGEEKAKPSSSDGGTLGAPGLPTGVTITYANGRIEATYTPITRQDVFYEFQYILSSDVASDNWNVMSVIALTNFAYGSPVIRGETYSVRWRTTSNGGLVSAWSSPLYEITIGFDVGLATQFTATGGVGESDLEWRNPTGADFGYVEIYRHTTSTFASATSIAGPLYGGLGQVQTYTDTVAAGTYYYWIVPFASDTTQATQTGPQSAVVT